MVDHGFTGSTHAFNEKPAWIIYLPLGSSWVVFSPYRKILRFVSLHLYEKNIPEWPFYPCFLKNPFIVSPDYQITEDGLWACKNSHFVLSLLVLLLPMRAECRAFLFARCVQVSFLSRALEAWPVLWYFQFMVQVIWALKSSQFTSLPVFVTPIKNACRLLLYNSFYFEDRKLKTICVVGLH